MSEYEEKLLGQLAKPIISEREQILYKTDRIGALIDLGVDVLVILEAIGGSEAWPEMHGDRERWAARAPKFAPEWTAYGDTVDLARKQLLERLRRYDPDEW